MPNKLIPEEHRLAMATAYESGMSTRACADLFGYSQPVMKKTLAMFGMKMRNLSESHQRYCVSDPRWFQHIDTEQKAYWAGFITADGCVRDRKNRPFELSVKIKASDATHLEKFRHDLGCEHPVAFYDNPCNGKRYPRACLSISHQWLCDDLISHGITPRKSWTVCPMDPLDSVLQRHYWRGVFDGDGCISIRGAHISLCGNAYMTSGFAQFIERSVGISHAPRWGHRVYVVSYNIFSECLPILQLLYSESAVFLDRKHVLFKIIETNGSWAKSKKECGR